MSRAQRFTFLGIALVIAVVAVVLIAGGSGDSTDDDTQTTSGTSTPTPTPTQEQPEASPQETETPTPTPTATPTPKPTPLLTSGKVTRLEFKDGETVRFRVRSAEDEEIHIHGYDIEKEIPGGETTPVSFKATIQGIFEIEFHGSGEQIGELRVQPN
jgi:FtsP/CotA-like multicopper oxidase with cupredoxin domain